MELRKVKIIPIIDCNVVMSGRVVANSIRQFLASQTVPERLHLAKLCWRTDRNKMKDCWKPRSASKLRHLIDILARDQVNPPLAAGEIVTTGTLTRALPVTAGETWTTELTGIGLGGICVRFA